MVFESMKPGLILRAGSLVLAAALNVCPSHRARRDFCPRCQRNITGLVGLALGASRPMKAGAGCRSIKLPRGGFNQSLHSESNTRAAVDNLAETGDALQAPN